MSHSAEIAVEDGFFAFGQAHFADDFVRLCKVAFFGEGFHFFGYVFRLAFVKLYGVGELFTNVTEASPRYAESLVLQGYGLAVRIRFVDVVHAFADMFAEETYNRLHDVVCVGIVGDKPNAISKTWGIPPSFCFAFDLIESPFPRTISLQNPKTR